MCKAIITDTIFGVPTSAFKGDATPSEIAGLFCHLSDDEMAEFFVAVDKISRAWEGNGASWQWHKTGEHMAECLGSCESSAISIIEDILSGYKYRQDHPKPLANVVNHRAAHEAGEGVYV